MKYNIKDIRKRLGLTQAALCEIAGISQSYLSLIETGARGIAPSMETLAAIGRALNVSPSHLIYNGRPVPIVGKVGAGAHVPLVDSYATGGGMYSVSCPFDLFSYKDIVGVEIEGDSMLPVYSDGDVIFYTRDVVGIPSEAIGTVCVCQDQEGDVWLKHIKPGSTHGTFNLISFNPLVNNMIDVVLEWAAPIKLHWPKSMVEKV